MKLRRRHLAALALAWAPSAHADDFARSANADSAALFAPFTVDDLVLISVSAGGKPIADSMVAYSSTGGLYLPVGELSRLLDLAIMVDPPQRKANGWLLQQDRKFEIDLKAGKATSGPTTITIGHGDAWMKDDEIYVRAKTLEQLLPLRFKPDFGNLALEIEPLEKLPFQDRADRLERAAQASRDNAAAATLPERPLPFRLFTPPTLDLTMDGRFARGDGESRVAYDLRAAGDFLFAGLQANLGSNQYGGLDYVRLQLERKDPTGDGSAGPFGLTRSTIGDTYTPSMLLGARSSGGRGFFIGSEPLDRAELFDQTDLRGELPSGYQVELYVNEILRASQFEGVGGQYFFRSVPLTYGSNVIRLVFYGPHGERRQEVRRISVGSGQLAKGQSAFSLGVVEQDVPVVPLDLDTDQMRTFQPGAGRVRGVMRYGYGLTSNLTMLGGAAVYTPRPGDQRMVFNLGLNGSVLGMGVQTTYAVDDSHGKALALGLAMPVLGVDVVAQHNELRHGFVDENNPLGALPTSHLVRSTAVRADLPIALGSFRLPVSLDVRRDEDKFAGARLRGSARTSFPLGHYLFSTAVDLVREPGSGLRMRGGSDLSGVIATGWQLKASATYDIEPTLELSAGSLSLDRIVNERFSLRAAVAHRFNGPRRTTLQASSSIRLTNALFSLSGAYTPETRDYAFGVQINVAALYDPIRKAYRLAPPGAASTGLLLVNAFRDTNGNGRRDPDEEGVAKLPIHTASRTAATKKDGFALVGGLSDGAATRVEIATEELEDPYLTAASPGFILVGRPGRVAVEDVPFAAAGEVTLHAALEGKLDGRGISALGIRLVDARGATACIGRTEFDGSLFCEGLRQGRYAIALDPAQSERLGIALSSAPEVVVPATGGYVGTVEVRIKKR